MNISRPLSTDIQWKIFGTSICWYSMRNNLSVNMYICIFIFEIWKEMLVVGFQDWYLYMFIVHVYLLLYFFGICKDCRISGLVSRETCGLKDWNNSTACSEMEKYFKCSKSILSVPRVFSVNQEYFECSKSILSVPKVF